LQDPPKITKERIFGLKNMPSGNPGRVRRDRCLFSPERHFEKKNENEGKTNGIEFNGF
jgi:hypothetical protein